jgi:hypothetical protein
MGTSAVHVTSIVGSMRLKSVEIWAPPASQGSSSTCSVEWAATPNSAFSEVSDTSMSVSNPAYVKARPPRNSRASWWQNVGDLAEQLMFLIAPSGSVIDIVVEYILYDDDSGTNPLLIVVTTATIGQMYYLALDTGVAGTHIYPPVSLSTTF